jgi:hypothetical protein
MHRSTYQASIEQSHSDNNNNNNNNNDNNNATDWPFRSLDGLAFLVITSLTVTISEKSTPSTAHFSSTTNKSTASRSGSLSGHSLDDVYQTGRIPKSNLVSLFTSLY